MSIVISVTQQKGGAGKTTIAAHIAVALSQKGKKVGLIDTDPQQSLSSWYELRQQKFGDEYTRLNFVQTTGWRVESSINKMRDECDYIIIDTPPQIQTEAKSTIRCSDMVIIPMQPSPADLWATKKIIDFVELENKKYAIIFNRSAVNSKLTKTISGNLKNLFKTIICNRVSFASCLLQGKTVTEVEPKSAAANEIKSLVKEIEAEVKSKTKVT